MDIARLGKLDCRICEKAVGKQAVYFHTEAANTSQTFAEIYQYLFGVEPNDGPQDLCLNCSKILISTYQLRKRIKDNEKILQKHLPVISDRPVERKVTNYGSVKEEIREIHEKDPMTDDVENVVVKVEPQIESVTLEMDVSDNDDDDDEEESSSDDDVPLRRRSKPKTNKKKSRAGKRVEDFVIECPLCDFKSSVKDTYQKHTFRVHNRQEMICDGCEESFHLIYVLLEHRKYEHDFTHEYKVVTKPLPEGANQQDSAEEEEIKCPLCDYKSNVKNNYQKHVIRSHNRQELQCEKCDYKHHLIYYLEEHRREKHNLYTTYEADESLKLKTFEKRFGFYKIRMGNNDGDGDDEEIYGCPLCSYKSSRVTRFSDHYKNMHDNLEMTCDGCSAKFHLYYRLLEHRKLDHKFDHPYVVPESIILEDKNRKEQRRLEKGQHYPCPECDRWFTERRNVAKHLRIVHKYLQYKTSDLKMLQKEIGGGDDGGGTKKKYSYPKVVCSFCGKLYTQSSLENHIRHRHPEHRDPFICHFCDHPAKTKHKLMIHMFAIHKCEIKIAESEKKKKGGTRKQDSSIIKMPDGKMEFCCRYCPERYPFRVSRKRHEISVHTNEWPYECELCGKKFILQFELKKHLNRHREGKRLSCSRCQTCGENFTKKKLLERHVCPNAPYPDSLPDHLQHFATYR